MREPEILISAGFEYTGVRNPETFKNTYGGVIKLVRRLFGIILSEVRFRSTYNVTMS